MKLSTQQRLFTRTLGGWISEVYLRGYELTFGEAFRSDEQAEINAIGTAGRARVAQLIESEFPLLAGKLRNNGKNSGIRNSLHEQRLATDFNLFRNGVYLDKTDDWISIGLLWEQAHPLCRWGGRFNDGNHISMTYGGKS